MTENEANQSAEEQEKKAAELASKQNEVNPDGKGNPPDPGSGQED